MHASARVVTGIVAVLCGITAVGAAMPPASYPVRPIRLVVPFAPGGTNDVLARIVGDKLGERLGQPLVTDNRAGAGSVLGTEIVARANPDGYTLLLTSAVLAVNPSILRTLPYDTLRDFSPIGLVGSGPYLMCTPVSAREDSGGIYRLGKVTAGAGQLRVGRDRQSASSRGRASKDDCRHRHAARSVQGRLGSIAGSDRRSCLDVLRFDFDFAAADSKCEVARDRRYDRAKSAGDTGCADIHGIRPA